MPSLHALGPDKLARLIGLPTAPAIIDVRDDAEFAADPRLIPGAIRRAPDQLPGWAPALAGRAVVVAGAAHTPAAAATAAMPKGAPNGSPAPAPRWIASPAPG